MDLAAEEWVKHALVEAERRRCISKVLSLESEPAVGRGENYCSEMFRLKVKVVNGAGEMEEKTVIFKILPTAIYRRWGMKQSGFFDKEAKVYQYVLPPLEKLLKAYSIGTFWPEFYGVRGHNEGYIMQDAGALGYTVADRKTGLDFDHCFLVLESIAKWHAGSCVLIEKGEIVLADFQGYCFAECREMSEGLYKFNIEQLAMVLEHKWKGEWVDYAKGLHRFLDGYFEKVLKAFKTDAESRFKVLCHGDIWTNNILFKHDKSGRPVDLKLIDYQVSFIGTPAWDLEYFFTTSLMPSESHRRAELLEAYQRSLEGYLKQFGAMAKAPTVAELEDFITNIKILTFMAGIVLKPLIIIPSEEAPDVDKFTDEVGPTNEMKALFDFSYDGEDYVKAIKDGLRYGKKHGFI